MDHSTKHRRISLSWNRLSGWNVERIYPRDVAREPIRDMVLVPEEHYQNMRQAYLGLLDANMVQVDKDDLRRLFENAFNDVRVVDMDSQDVEICIRIRRVLEGEDS